ncbi:hypothetical protein [Paenibacillus xylanilyticus]|uniref:hypothetical protein n=1 Tax=Paenibacillus xylanilyticus TaxID=248903 RepID=UPI003AAA6F27
MNKADLITLLQRSEMPGDAPILVWRPQVQRLTTDIQLREVGGQIVIEEVEA